MISCCFFLLLIEILFIEHSMHISHLCLPSDSLATRVNTDIQGSNKKVSDISGFFIDVFPATKGIK